MQIIELVISVLAVASMATATPFAPYLNQTKLSLAMTQGSTYKADSFLFASSAAVSTDIQKRAVNYTEPDPTEHNSVVKRHEDAKTEEEGRIGKLPYRKFPPCYVKCFDSEGVDSKTWPAIGDIRDLTTYEFCESQAMWVARWLFEHLRFCIHGECSSCLYDCGMASGKVYKELCGRNFW